MLPWCTDLLPSDMPALLLQRYNFVPSRLHAQGFKLSLKLQATHSRPGMCKLGLFIGYGGMMADISGCNRALSTNVSFSTRRQGHRASYTMPSRLQCAVAQDTCMGSADYFKTGPISSITELSEFIVDGQLKLRARFKKLDGQEYLQ